MRRRGKRQRLPPWRFHRSREEQAALPDHVRDRLGPASMPDSGIDVFTTLDPRLQDLAQRLVTNHVGDLAPDGGR
jgi:membrane peptidoglycan carboxypeptidase